MKMKFILDLSIKKWRAESPGCSEFIGLSFLMACRWLLNVCIRALPRQANVWELPIHCISFFFFFFPLKSHHTDVHASGIDWTSLSAFGRPFASELEED